MNIMNASVAKNGLSYELATWFGTFMGVQESCIWVNIIGGSLLNKMSNISGLDMVIGGHLNLCNNDSKRLRSWCVAMAILLLVMRINPMNKMKFFKDYCIVGYILVLYIRHMLNECNTVLLYMHVIVTGEQIKFLQDFFSWQYYIPNRFIVNHFMFAKNNTKLK